MGYPTALQIRRGVHPAYRLKSTERRHQHVTFKVWDFQERVVDADGPATGPCTVSRRLRRRNRRTSSVFEIEIVEDEYDLLKTYRVDFPTPNPDKTIFIDAYRFLEDIKACEETLELVAQHP